MTPPAQTPTVSLEDRLDRGQWPTICEPHRRIGQLLDDRTIPFFYRPDLLIYENNRPAIWQPDFVVPQWHGLVLDYAEHRSPITEYKEQVYQANGVPAVLVYPETVYGPEPAEILFEMMYEATRKAVERQSIRSGHIQPGQ